MRHSVYFATFDSLVCIVARSRSPRFSRTTARSRFRFEVYPDLTANRGLLNHRYKLLAIADADTLKLDAIIILLPIR